MSLFEDSGEMRVSKDKAKLKKALQVVSPNRIYCNVDAVVIDGSALLWTVHWPTKGTVEDLAKAVLNNVSKFLQQSDVYLVFDGYFDYSIKGCTRVERCHTTPTSFPS